MTELILASIKSLLNVEVTDTAFDDEIAMHLNGVFMHLCQLGVGPVAPFYLDASNYDTATWGTFLGTDYHNFEAVKTFCYLRVKLLFDPPTVGAVMTSTENLAKEYEWRLSIQKNI